MSAQIIEVAARELRARDRIVKVVEDDAINGRLMFRIERPERQKLLYRQAVSDPQVVPEAVAQMVRQYLSSGGDPNDFQIRTVPSTYALTGHDLVLSGMEK